jgi:hypothetical protein
MACYANISRRAVIFPRTAPDDLDWVAAELKRSTTQTPRVQETDRTDRILAVALTARIRRSPCGTLSRGGP